MDDLGNFGFSLGEIWDLEMTLQNLELSAKDSSDEVTLNTATPVITQSDPQLSEEMSHGSVASPNLNSTESVTLGSDSEESEEEEMDPECKTTILKYVSEEVFAEMSKIDRVQFFNRIEHYEHLVTKKGFENLPRPTYTVSCIREKIVSQKKPAKKTGPKARTVVGSTRVLRKRSVASVQSTEEESEDAIRDSDDAGPSTKKTIILKRSFRQKNLLKQAINSASKRDTIIAEHLGFLESNTLTQVQKKIIRDFLECPSHLKFKILEIVEKVEDTDELVESLKTEGFCSGEMLKFLLDILVDHLYSLHSDPNALLTIEREAMAVSLVATFPKFAQRCTKEGEKPWTWLFGKSNGVGKLANNIANRQKLQDTPRARSGGQRKAPQKKEQPVILKRAIDPSELSNETKYLGCISHIDSNKVTIVSLAKQTFQERRNYVMDEKYLLDSVLQQFKYLKAFKGEMIFLEFELMNPTMGDNLIRDGHQYIEKLLKLGYAEPKKYGSVSNLTKDDCLNALMILTKFLPLPKRVYAHEKKMSLVAELDHIYQLVPVGSGVELEISRRREECRHPIQPYVMAMGDRDQIVSQYLVLGDGHSIQLPEQPTLKTIDLLLKAHYVFNVPYYLAWKNAFRFLSVQILGLPLENPRQSNFTAEHVELFNRF